MNLEDNLLPLSNTDFYIGCNHQLKKESIFLHPNDLSKKILKLTGNDRVLLIAVLLSVYSKIFEKLYPSRKVLFVIPGWILGLQDEHIRFFPKRSVSESCQEMLSDYLSQIKGLFYSSQKCYSENYENLFKVAFIFDEYTDIERHLSGGLIININTKNGGPECSLYHQFDEDNDSFVKKLVSDSILDLTEIPRKLDEDNKVRRLNFINDICVLNNYSFYDFFCNACKLFEDKKAIICGEEEITYFDLLVKVNQRCAFFLSEGVNKGAKVAIDCGSSIEHIISMLAALSLQCVYIPVNLNESDLFLIDQYNELKFDYLVFLQNSSRSLFISGTIGKPLIFDSAFSDLRSTSFPIDKNVDLIAYIIWSSGSSGKRKAVIISVSALLASIAARLDFYGKTDHSSLLLSPFTFDSSLAVIFGALFSGERLVLGQKGLESDPASLVHYINRCKVSSLLMLPSYLRVLLENDQFISLIKTLNRLIVAGEQLDRVVAEQVLSLLPRDSEFINEYGPTENTIWSTAYRISDLTKTPVPIGSSIGHVKLYILDDNLMPVLSGCIGNIYLSGHQLSIGYANDPRKTAQRFLPDSVSNDWGARMYDTGDRGSISNKGDVTFHGRISRLFKVSGYLIDPEEIELSLCMIEGVQGASVFSQEISCSVFVLSAVVMADQKMEKDIRSTLSSYLPNYMSVTNLFFVDDLPLLASGKIDHERAKTLFDNTSPQSNELFGVGGLLPIWVEVFGHNNISMTSNFYEIGGTSIQAAMIINRIKSFFGVNISFYEFMKCPALKDLERLIHIKFKEEI